LRCVRHDRLPACVDRYGLIEYIQRILINWSDITYIVAVKHILKEDMTTSDSDQFIFMLVFHTFNFMKIIIIFVVVTEVVHIIDKRFCVAYIIIYILQYLSFH